jgi:ABC-type polysaccharide/polyol phosphate export permease
MSESVHIPQVAGSAEPAGENEPGGWARSLHVLVALARSDLRIRYGRGPWQLVNWFLTPFVLVGVFVLLRVMLDRTGEAVGLSIACAVVPFQIVSQSSTSAMSAVSLRQPILLNRRFDTMLIPSSAVLTETLAFATSFVMFPLMMLIYSVGPAASLVWLPVVVATTLVLSLGAAWPAALLGIWAPKVSVFASQALRILFFASAGLVALSEVPSEVHDWVVINPFTPLFESYRHLFLYGDAPPLWELAYPLGLGVLLWLLFLPLYRREKRHFAKLVTSL